ncbi:MAG: aldehyde dehydrogenase (NADP(+)) [Planctomycetes bacterium]|nr:aldehyde dehydrogenase (NADP(+)) [Planctomycetota bacterium]
MAINAQPVLIAGRWREAHAAGTFQSDDPVARTPLPEAFPVSTWKDCDEALDAAVEAAEAMRRLSGEQIAAFLEKYADRIEARKDDLVATAHAETALPVSPRLADVELPRTTGQLRQAAAAAREGSWAMPTIDTKNNIRSYLAPLGPVAVFGPNNFPFAFNSAAGGDFAAAVAAGNPVIAKANTTQPATSRIFAEEAAYAVEETGLPAATVQLLYRTSHADGERLVADPRLGATAYTGSRAAGLNLKAAADKAGKPIYLELSSINPVVVLPGALKSRMSEIADEFTQSCLLGAGQFCTNPGLVILLKSLESDTFVSTVIQRFQAAPAGTLLSKGVESSLAEGVTKLRKAGARLLTGDAPGDGPGYCRKNTLLEIRGAQFLDDPHVFQTEAFGNASLVVIADDIAQAEHLIERLEGNLTGCIYSDAEGADDAIYDRLAPRLGRRVGRLLNDKMPTGVAVSPAMNHGGPYPATGHPGFTAVGIPAALRRFGMLQCFDNVRPSRLPALLQDKNPTGRTWRFIDGQWTQGDIG